MRMRYCSIPNMVRYIVSIVFILGLRNGHGQKVIHEVHNSAMQPNCSMPLLNEAPIWCPYNYQLLYLDKWTRVCKPSACVEMNLFEDNPPEFPAGVCLEYINPQVSTIKLCRNDPFRMLDDNFITCPKEMLADFHHKVQVNGSLWNKRDSTILPLGNYFMFENKSVLICNGSRLNSNSDPKNIIPWCVPVRDVDTKFPKELIRSLVQAGHSIVEESEPMSTVCIMASETISSCNINSSLMWFSGAFRIDVDQTLIDLIISKEILFGGYFLDLNITSYYYCEKMSWVSIITRYAQGSACLLSHVCLLITVSLHLLYPKLNYYSRALFSHALYICILYLFFGINLVYLGAPSRILAVVVFIIVYVCGLTAFLWLNVLAFELWNSFATLQHVTIGRRYACMTRRYFLECLYAYGLTFVACAIIIIIRFNRSIQRALKLDISVTSYGEFENLTTQRIFQGIPLQIILVFNVIFYILTVLSIRRTTNETDIINRKRQKNLMTIFGKLLLVLGITWVPNLVLYYTQMTNSEIVNGLIRIFDALQGVFIFLVYCCNRRTIRIVKKTPILKWMK